MKLLISESLKSVAGDKKEIVIDATSVEQLRTIVKETEPKLYRRIYDEQGIQRKFVNLYINKQNIKYLDGNYKIDSKDEVTIITAVAGG